MANTKANVSVAKPQVSGAVSIAPAGSTMPTDATSPLDPAFKSLGYLSEDGLTETPERETTETRAWGGDIVKNSTKSYTEKYSFTCIETNAEVLKLRHGDKNVSEHLEALTIKHTGEDLPIICLVAEVLMDDGRIDRKCIAECQVIEVGEASYQDGEVIAYPVTVQALKHEGAYVLEYIAKAE